MKLKHFNPLFDCQATELRVIFYLQTQLERCWDSKALQLKVRTLSDREFVRKSRIMKLQHPYTVLVILLG